MKRIIHQRIQALLLALVMAGTAVLNAPVTISAEEAVTEAVTEAAAEAVTETPQEETAAPETAAPETAAPETVAPETAAPETAAPETAAAETTAAETAAAVTTEPETAAPETQGPTDPAGETEAPITDARGPETEKGKEAEETETESEEAAYPAVIFRDILTEDGILLTVEAPEGALPEGVRAAVEKVDLRENGKDPERAAKILKKLSDAVYPDSEETVEPEQAAALDIWFYLEETGRDVHVQPEKPVKLTFRDVKVEGDLLYVYHIADKKETDTEEPKARLVSRAPVANPQEGKTVLEIDEAKEFSVYAIVGTEIITTTYLTADGSTYEVTVTYGKDAGVPKDAQLLVTEFTEEDAEYDEYVEQTAALIDSEAATLSYIKLLDISILDTNGKKVKLKAPVDVQIRLLDKDSIQDNIQVVHFFEDIETNTVEPELLDNSSDGDTIEFQTNSFSAYAIVQGPAAIQPGWLRVSSISQLDESLSEGLYIGTTSNYYLTNTTTAHANGNNSIAGLSGIKRSTSTRAYPTDDAALYYFEAVEGTTNQFYICCYDDNNNKLYATYDTEATSVPYSIILTEDETAKTPCTLSVYGSGASAYWRIRFNNNANLRWYLRNNIIDAQNADTNFYIWKNAGGDTYGLDGKTYGLMYWVDGIMGKGLMSDANETVGHLDALPLTVMSKPNNGAKLYVPDNSDLSFWTFHFIEEDYYYLTTVVDGSTKYLRVGTAAEGLSLVSTPDDSCKIHVVPGSGANAGKICLKVGNRTLTYSGDIDSGFQIGGAAGNEWLNLVEESELTNDYFMTYSASKVSVSDENITNGSRIIVYTRVWNETTTKYEFYAIDHDGSLVRCYESGDSIEWVGGRLNSMLWNFIEYYWERTNDPNYYYDLYNQYSDKFIAPQASDGQIISDDRIGINLNGRRNGLYYSPIVAWDDAYYAYAGLKADTATGKIVSCSLSEADDFYFAIVHDIPVDDELTIIPTIDHTQYGITMKMVNFGTDIFTGNDNANVQSKMSAFLGSANSSQGYNAESGLLNTALVGGYPVVSSNGNSLSTWFSNAQEVNQLFIASTYSGTGYFEYDSVQNFAHLNQDTNNFVVYKELGSDNTGGPTHTHGLFFPYNDITAGVFSPNKNTTAISSAALPESDPRKYETMYLVQKSNTNYAPDYYFGMELTATFTQTPNGLDDWGHDIIYEFTGDDDFWLFVDGELIIDLGGIHSAISGDVNYRTGVVHVNGTSTTLRSLFESNYRGRNLGLSDADVAAYLNEIFDGEIFKDYTTHTMSIYYLEHGAGSSNLHMRFNLASIKPGTAQLTKKLSGVDTTETVLAEFPYQIIYRTKTGDTVSDPIYLSNSVPNDPTRVEDYVFYKDMTVACAYEPSYSIAGKTYNDVFILKPDETVDINFPTETFPEGTELYDYKIIECGVNTDVYESVKENDVQLPGTSIYDSQNNLIENRKDYGIDYATTDERARVVYDNTVASTAITNLTIQKKLYDVTGENEITDDNTTFDFRLYLATESGNVDDSPANMHTYHVKDTDGNYCKWDVASQRLVSLGEGKNNFDDLTDEEKNSATFHTSMNGAISKIPVGYTIEVRDLLVGTKFKVVERPWEIPDGYSFIRYEYNGTKYQDAVNGVTDIINTATALHVEVHNIKGFGLRVNKTWTDADFMAERDPAYFGIFYEGSDSNLHLVEGSLRQMAYGISTLYWYYDHLPVSGITDFEKYSIYEVKLTNPAVDSDGNVTSYSSLECLDGENNTITLSGKQIGDASSSMFTYTVTYDRGELSTNSYVRVDEITNSRPGIILKKTKWDGTTALAGAVFTLVDENGNSIGTYTSGEDGLITEAFLRSGVKYTLTELSSPQGYHGLELPMVIKIEDGSITIKDSDGQSYDSNYYKVEQGSGSTNAEITVKNRPYKFEVIKKDKGTNAPLANVSFRLYREIVVEGVHAWDPNPYPGYENIVSGTDGILPGVDNTLPAGRFQLREISPLSGYQALSGYITFTVSETGVITSSGNQPDEALFSNPSVQDDGSILYQITVTNAKVFKVSIWKTDEGYNTITAGATFDLYKAEDYNDSAGHPNEGASPVVTGTTGTNGILSLGSLIVGEYRLVETQAPDGYNLATSAIKVTVNNSGVSAFQASAPCHISRSTAPDNTYWVSGQDSSTWQIRVWNNSGVELPMTGGSGTLPYTLGGIALIMASALMYGFRMRRRERRLN